MCVLRLLCQLAFLSLTTVFTALIEWCISNVKAKVMLLSAGAIVISSLHFVKTCVCINKSPIMKLREQWCVQSARILV